MLFSLVGKWVLFHGIYGNICGQYGVEMMVCVCVKNVPVPYRILISQKR